jgi:uncharacterized protein (UPF0264 family)
MKVLISIVSLEEARIAVEGKADILDIKNPHEGSLGAQFPWVLKEIVNEFKGSGILCSAALGDLSYKPGTAALAAFGTATCGVEYIKAGLLGATNYDEAFNMMKSIVRAIRMVNKNAVVVAAGYADYKRFGGVPYKDLVNAAKDSGSDVVMVDTAIKDGKNLLDAMNLDQIKEFIDLSHDAGMYVALAGSIKKEHLEDLARLNPDIVGIRGEVCDNEDRKSGISLEKVKEFMACARAINPHNSSKIIRHEFVV